MSDEGRDDQPPLAEAHDPAAASEDHAPPALGSSGSTRRISLLVVLVVFVVVFEICSPGEDVTVAHWWLGYAGAFAALAAGLLLVYGRAPGGVCRALYSRPALHVVLAIHVPDAVFI